MKASDIKAELFARVAFGACRLLSGMSDRGLLAVLRAARAVISEPAAREGLDELIDAVSSGEPNTTLVKKMLAESRYDELSEIMRSLFAFKEMDLEDV